VVFWSMHITYSGKEYVIGILTYDDEGLPHNLVGDQLSEEQQSFLQNEAFRGYDNDSGMTMLRIGSMNLMLHGLGHPRFYYMDTLSKAFTEEKNYDVISDESAV